MSEDAASFREWLESEDGRRCGDLLTLHMELDLRARLQVAFCAGAASVQRPVVKRSAKAKGGEEPSEKAWSFARWFLTLLPATVRMDGSISRKWAKCYDDMIRLDSRTPEQIAAVCKWARAHAFWQANFQSPLKLRQRDKAGVLYFDIFFAAMNPQAARRVVQQSREHGIGSAGPDVETMQ